MAKPNSRQTLIDYCLRSLGAPVIEINIDEDQIEDRIDEGLHERPRLQRLVDRNRPRTILWSIRALALITIQLIPPELVP